MYIYIYNVISISIYIYIYVDRYIDIDIDIYGYINENKYLSRFRQVSQVQLGVCTNDKVVRSIIIVYQIALYRQLTILKLATGYLHSQLTIFNTIFFFHTQLATPLVALAIFSTYVGLPQISSYMNHKIYRCNKLFIITSFYSEIVYCHFKYSSASGGSQHYSNQMLAINYNVNSHNKF